MAQLRSLLQHHGHQYYVLVAPEVPDAASDQGCPELQALDGIAHELQRLYDMLDERDFAAGSALARRLFS